jgi:3-oxoadipate enol-lactonase
VDFVQSFQLGGSERLPTRALLELIVVCQGSHRPLLLHVGRRRFPHFIDRSNGFTGKNRVEFNGASIWVESLGSEQDPALVLIYSGIANARMWDPIIGALSVGHQVIRYDCREFGRTTTEDVVFSDVDDVLAVMAAMGVERATLVGASRGGGIALDTALAHPDQVTGLVTIGSSPSGFPEVQLNPQEQLISDRLDELQAQGELVAMNRLEAELWAAGTTRNLSALNAANLSHIDDDPTRTPAQQPACARIVEITVPSLFVIGDHDLSPQLAGTRSLLAMVPNATEARFPDSAYSPSIERPAGFIRMLSAWLNENGL